MARIRLGDWPQVGRSVVDPRIGPIDPTVRLVDDIGVREVPAQLPKVTLLRRKVVGRTTAGDRVFGWDEVLENVQATSWINLSGDDEHDVMRLRVTVLLDEFEEDVLAFRIEGWGDPDWVYRITEREFTGTRMTLVGERSL